MPARISRDSARKTGPRGSQQTAGHDVPGGQSGHQEACMASRSALTGTGPHPGSRLRRATGGRRRSFRWSASVTENGALRYGIDAELTEKERLQQRRPQAAGPVMRMHREIPARAVSSAPLIAEDKSDAGPGDRNGVPEGAAADSSRDHRFRTRTLFPVSATLLARTRSCADEGR